MHMQCNTNGQKSWCFPKFHILQHSFSSFQAKGVSANTSTKPWEHEHLWMHKVFQSSNFKDMGKKGMSSLITTSLASLTIVLILGCHICRVDSHTRHDTTGSEGSYEH